MRRDFSSLQPSSIPTAFLNNHKEDVNQPTGFKSKVKNFVRFFHKLRRNRVTVVLVLAGFNTFLFLRMIGYWSENPGKTTPSVSADLLAQMKSMENSMGPTTPVDELLTPSKPGMVLPNTLIIGAAYCGSNPLSAFLSLHPNIAVTQGQTRFFTENYEKGLDWYSSQIRKPNKNQYVILERSPDYIYSVKAPKRIKAVNESMKIIVLLRNPVKRLISDYTTAVLAKLTPEEAKVKTFEKMVIDPVSHLANADKQGVKNSVYYAYLKRWFDTFEREQIHVIDGDSFIKNPLPELKNIETFLRLSHVFKEDNLYFNSSSGYFCPKIRGEPHCFGHEKGWRHLHEADYSVLERLKNFFRHHNENLYELIGTRFEWA